MFMHTTGCRLRVADCWLQIDIIWGVMGGGVVFECRAAGRCMIVFVLALLGFILV